MDFKRKNSQIKVMQENEKEGVSYLTFPAFAKTGLVEHLFSTKKGGISKGIYESMNLSYTRGDDEKAVDENYRRIANVLNRNLSDFVLSKQTHTTNIKVVTKEDAGKGLLIKADYADVDGLITNVSKIVLATVFADCVPLFFLDPVTKAIGLSHAGWRGSADRMAEKTIVAMQREYGCNPADILVGIGPSICAECYEVGEDVYAEFPQAYFTKNENGKYQLDLWRANEEILQEAGVSKEHIYVTDICTCCNSSLLFSHRATQGKRGNLGAFLSLH